MIKNMLAQIDIVNSSSKLLETGIMGAFLLLVTAALVVLWLAYQKELDSKQKMSETMIELSTKLTILVEDTFSIVKSLPSELKEKIKPDLDSIQKTVDEIKSNLRK